MKVPVVPWQLRMLFDTAIVAAPFYLIARYPYGFFTAAEEHNRKLRKHDFDEVRWAPGAAERIEAARAFYASNGFEDCL